MLILPELAAALYALFFAVSGTVLRSRPRLSGGCTLMAGAVLLLCTGLGLSDTGAVGPGLASSPLSQACKLLLALAFLGLLIADPNQSGINPRLQPAFRALLFVQMLALMLLTSATNLLMLCAALFCAVLSLTLLVSMRGERQGIRSGSGSPCLYAGLLAAGLLLLGMAVLLMLTGMPGLTATALAMQHSSSRPLAGGALALVLAGFSFLLAPVPFHAWLPDTCRHATGATAFLLLTLPGIAAVAVLFRLTSWLPPDAERFMTVPLAVLALCSLVVGNLCALVQQDVRRLLAFNAVAQAGLILLCLQGQNPALALFATAAWLPALLCCALPLQCIMRQGSSSPCLSDLRGLSREQPLLVLMLAAGLFSMSGLPPFAGFVARLQIFIEIMNAGHTGIALLAVCSNVLALAVSLRVLGAACAPAEGRPACPMPSMGTLALGLSAVLVLLLAGVLPSKCLNLIAAHLGSP